MTPEWQKAIQRYLVALEANLKTIPGNAVDEGLADAHEYLTSEWESVDRLDPWIADESRIFTYLVSRFGTPAEVAQAYANVCEPGQLANGPTTGDHATSDKGSESASVGGRRGWTMVACTVTIAVFTAWNWFHSGSSRAASNRPAHRPVALDFQNQQIRWADQVSSSRRGKTPFEQSSDPKAALGTPDCLSAAKQSDRYYSLGFGGNLVLDFREAKLTDGPGPDLVIVEIGYSEPIQVSISNDASTWIDLGKHAGKLMTIDIAPQVAAGDSYRFIRIADACSRRSEQLGADIDAVGLLHVHGHDK